MKQHLKNALGGASLFALLAVSNGAFAAITEADVTPIQTEIISAIGIAAAAGLAIMAVALGWDVGMSLIRKFVKRGAR